MDDDIAPSPLDGYIVRRVEPGPMQDGELPDGAEIVHTEVIHYVRIPRGGETSTPVLDVTSSEVIPSSDRTITYVESVDETEKARRLTPSVVAATVLAVLALFGFALYARSRAGDEAVQAVSDALTESRVSDDFDRPSTGPLDGEAPLGAQWSSLGPGFDVADGVATVAESPAGEVTLAIIDPGWPDQSSGLTIENAAANAGLVFRFVDIFNYWSLVAAPDFGTWNLVLTIDGEPIETLPTGLSFSEGPTRLSLVTEGPEIRVFIDGLPVLDLTDPTFDRASATGIIATAGTDASFSEIFVIERSAAAPTE